MFLGIENVPLGGKNLSQLKTDAMGDKMARVLCGHLECSHLCTCLVNGGLWAWTGRSSEKWGPWWPLLTVTMDSQERRSKYTTVPQLSWATLTLKTKEPVSFLTGEDADLGWAMSIISQGILTFSLLLGHLENVETRACRYVLFSTFNGLSHMHFIFCIFKSKPVNCACLALVCFLGSTGVSSSQSLPFRKSTKCTSSTFHTQPGASTDPCSLRVAL